MTTASLPVNPAVSYPALKQELATNPANLSAAVPGAGVLTLTAMAQGGHYQDAANLLNQQGGVAGATVNAGPYPPQAFTDKVLLQEVGLANMPAFASTWQSILAAGNGVNLNDASVWAVVQQLFPSTTQTYANLTAMKTRACSRAETLFGAGVVLVWQDISQAWLYS